MNYGPALLAILVGAGLTIQIGMNARVSAAVGSPVIAAAINFAVGLVLLVLLVLASGARMQPGAIAAVPRWAWFGGLLGATYVASVTLLGPRLGASALLALVLLGQLVSALLVDHFGVIGFPHNAATPVRLVGAALLLAGAILITRR